VRHLEVQQNGRLLGPITLSMGVAEFPRHGRNGDAVIRMADEALYRAKHGGRDRVEAAQTGDIEPERG
jgi:diguanylate cyclase (GGDEF)-like protein